MNKRGYIELGKKTLWLVLTLAILVIIMLSYQASAGTKANQYFVNNQTCENFTDTVIWSAVATKAGVDNQYYNWTMAYGCQGTRACDIIQLYAYARFVNGGDSDSAYSGRAYTRIANSSESDTGTFSRFLSYLNTTLAGGTTEGPRLECGQANATNTCNVTNRGFNDSTRKYAVHAYAHYIGGAIKANYITDNFNIRYTWCWTPIIYNLNIFL